MLPPAQVLTARTDPVAPAWHPDVRANGRAPARFPDVGTVRLLGPRHPSLGPVRYTFAATPARATAEPGPPPTCAILAARGRRHASADPRRGATIPPTALPRQPRAQCRSPGRHQHRAPSRAQRE